MVQRSRRFGLSSSPWYLVAVCLNVSEELAEVRNGYLVRILGLIGHVALRILIHLDVAYVRSSIARTFVSL